jgi:hypothetical protein
VRKQAETSMSHRKGEKAMIDKRSIDTRLFPRTSDAKCTIPEGLVEPFPDVNQVIGDKTSLGVIEVQLVTGVGG